MNVFFKSQFLRDQKNPRIPFTTENAEKIRNQAGGVPYQWYSWCAKVGAICSTPRCQKRGGKIQIWAILRNPVFRPLSSLAPPRIFYAGRSLNSKVLAMSRDIAAFHGSRFRWVSTILWLFLCDFEYTHAEGYFSVPKGARPPISFSARRRMVFLPHKKIRLSSNPPY